MKHNQTEIIRAISRGIIQCCLFADKPEGTNPRVTKQATQAAEAIAAQFVGIVGPFILNDAVKAYKEQPYNIAWPVEYVCKSIGHDVWYTTQGHGAGFWDRDFLKVDKYGDEVRLGQQLTEACRELRWVEPTFYRGWLYLE